MVRDDSVTAWRILVSLFFGGEGSNFLNSYKFIVDDDKWMVSDQEPILNDIEGHINNYLQVL